ncbi:MAG TPA: hypothetical protein VMV20_08040, partial [Chitinophagaceae bacterium]|nr:hypothetical protein [Chitinophagaceae bacterium]
SFQGFRGMQDAAPNEMGAVPDVRDAAARPGPFGNCRKEEAGPGSDRSLGLEEIFIEDVNAPATPAGDGIRGTGEKRIHAGFRVTAVATTFRIPEREQDRMGNRIPGIHGKDRV